MPRAPKKCANADCEERVQGRTYCKTHTPMNWEAKPRYATAEHRAWRKQVLARAKGQCELRYQGCTHRATEADHTIPTAEGGTTTLDNGKAACAPCHQKKTQQEALRGKQRAKQGASTPSPR